jgi:ribonuclease J
MTEHAELARELGAIPHVIDDGDILRLGPGPVTVVDSAPAGKLAVDGDRLLPIGGEVLAARRRMLEHGMVVASLALDESGRVLGKPRITGPGVFDAAMNGAAEGLTDELMAAVSALPAAVRRDDGALAEAARGALRGLLRRTLWQKRPGIEVHVMRIGR